jgi:hypothetical protein
MDNNWAEIRRQLDQVLECERAQAQARRRTSSWGQSLGRWWPAALRGTLRRSPIHAVFSSSVQPRADGASRSLVN